jgi:hypothetical protein
MVRILARTTSVFPAAARVLEPRLCEGLLLAEMQELRDRVAGLTGTAMASRDGLIIRADTGGADPDHLAALSAPALAVAQRMAREAGQGRLRETSSAAAAATSQFTPSGLRPC